MGRSKHHSSSYGSGGFAIWQSYPPADYNSAQKFCYMISGSDPQAEVREWRSRKEYQLLYDLSTAAGGVNMWVGFSDWGHPGIWRDGEGGSRPEYTPWFAGQEVLLDSNTVPDADCAYFEYSSSLVKLGSCFDKWAYICDE